MRFKIISFSPALIAILLISMTIALIAPFDFAFTAMTFGSPFLRVLLIAMMALIGTICAQRIGLRLEGHGARSPFALGMVVAVLVAVWVIALDAFLFRHLLNANYVQLIRSPLPARLSYYMVRAFNENVIYRLFVFPTLTCTILYLRGTKSLTPALIFSAMVMTQALNIGLNVVPHSLGRLMLADLGYDGLRYVAPGVLWAYLFWRFGFFTAEVASVGCHVFLQPVLGRLL